MMRRLFSRKAAATPAPPLPLPFRDLWEDLNRYSSEMQKSDFMRVMLERCATHGSQGVMGQVDCALLYALTRWRKPEIIIESGGWLGMSAAFILKALADERLTSARLYSVEWNRDCPHGVLIPEELRPGFVPVQGDIRELVKSSVLPARIDMFLHDSSHRYRHMLWEFREFWARLSDRGLLLSHDVHFTAAFAEFVAETYAHDPSGQLDFNRTTHYHWGRWGYLGFLLKKEAASARPK